jgi:hypothetical protein
MMAVLSTGPDSRAQWQDAGRLVLAGLGRLLYAAGWLIAKTLRTVGTILAAALFGVGWFASALAWPSLCWCGRAVRLGWQEGRKPIGGARGTS